MDKSEIMSKKLYEMIEKHGDKYDKYIDKFLKKGAKPESVLDYWACRHGRIDSNIILDLFGRIEMADIDQESTYFYGAMARYIQEHSVEDIVEYAKKFNKVLEVLMDGYKDAAVYERNMDLFSKYSQAISRSITNNVEVSYECLTSLVDLCARIPNGGVDYKDRTELMKNSYALLKQICSTNINVAPENHFEIPPKKRKAGALACLAAGSPVVENDDMCIDYIFGVCKLLMDKCADLMADRNEPGEHVISGICRKDFSKKLRDRLEKYYQEKNNWVDKEETTSKVPTKTPNEITK